MAKTAPHPYRYGLMDPARPTVVYTELRGRRYTAATVLAAAATHGGVPVRSHMGGGEWKTYRRCAARSSSGRCVYGPHAGHHLDQHGNVWLGTVIDAPACAR